VTAELLQGVADDVIVGSVMPGEDLSWTNRSKSLTSSSWILKACAPLQAGSGAAVSRIFTIVLLQDSLAYLASRTGSIVLSFFLKRLSYRSRFPSSFSWLEFIDIHLA
jgi:hypothetical protein